MLDQGMGGERRAFLPPMEAQPTDDTKHGSGDQ